MARFFYKAISATNTITRGEITADSEAAALDQIARQGLTPIDLSARHNKEPWWHRDISFSAKQGRLTPAELERFFFTLSTMLRAGFSLTRAIAFCERQSRTGKVRRILETVRSDLESGASLSQAMQRAGAAFPERFISLVSTGETANRLPSLSLQAAGLLSTEAHMRRELRASLIYPALLLLMAAAVMGVIVFYLAPTLLPVFSAANAKPPAFLSVLASLGATLLNLWPTLAALTPLVIFGVLVFRHRVSLSRCS